MQALVKKTTRPNWQWSKGDKIDAVRAIVDAEIARIGEQRVIAILLEQAAKHRGAMYVSQLLFDVQWPGDGYQDKTPDKPKVDLSQLESL